MVPGAAINKTVWTDPPYKVGQVSQEAMNSKIALALVKLCASACFGMHDVFSAAEMATVMLAGNTGVGKSSVGNRMLGFVPNTADEKPFRSVSVSEAKSVTFQVDKGQGYWLGNAAEGALTILDTPGDILRRPSVGVLVVLPLERDATEAAGTACCIGFGFKSLWIDS